MTSSESIEKHEKVYRFQTLARQLRGWPMGVCETLSLPPSLGLEVCTPQINQTFLQTI